MKKTALVLGGGFGGLESAIHLAKGGLDVTLVSNREYLFLYPTSIWVPTGEVELEDVTLDLADIARRRGFAFQRGTLESLDADRRSATIDGRELSADYVVLALGGGKMKPKGVEHTYTICGEPAATEKLRDALKALVDRGEGRIAMGFGGNPNDPSAVRGGPAFELMFNVETWLRRRGVRDRFELTFFAPMPVPGARMGKRAVESVAQMFEKHGIARRYGKKITAFEPGAVAFEDGAKLEADLVMFIAATDGHPAIKASALPKNAAGFVQVDHGCQVPGVKGFYAVGDVAALDGPEWRAKQGHVAEVMARTAAQNILAHAAGRPERVSYRPHVNILCVMDTGNGAAWVSRTEEKETLVSLPVVGHWMKKGWGAYFKATKKGLIPRIPGL